MYWIVTLFKINVEGFVIANGPGEYWVLINTSPSAKILAKVSFFFGRNVHDRIVKSDTLTLSVHAIVTSVPGKTKKVSPPGGREI